MTAYVFESRNHPKIDYDHFLNHDVTPGTDYYTSDEDIEENLRCIFPLTFALGIVDIQFSITHVYSGNKYFSEISIIYRFNYM